MEGDSKELAERHALEHAESLNVPQKKMGVDVITGGKARSIIQTLQEPDCGFLKNGGPCTCGQLSGEVRITDPNTGGQKGQKLQRFSLIPADFLWALATHYGIGAQKYEDRNWERGYKWSLSLDALERHLNLWKNGVSIDLETDSHHLIAAAWHIIALYIFETRNLGTDDVR